MAKEYVLVHGAAHGAWCWEEVAARLAAKGHRVVVPDLPGHGRRAAEVRRAGITAYAEAVAQAMALGGVSRAILVGHSMGGIVISKVAELAPQRIAHLVYLAAVALRNGESLLDVQGPLARALATGLAAGRGDGTFLYPAETAWARWMGDLRRDHPAAGRALASLTPQALRAFAEPAPLPRFWSLDIPRTYVRCLRDAAVTPERAAMFAGRLGVTPVDLDTAHDPMLSAPDDLARILDRIPA
jgi:pimeloyl-ACP methyl ester carboxylesterase